MFLVKFGGSVITDKTQECTPRLEMLDRLVAEVGKPYSAGQNIVVVHGAGSFGHIKAKRWQVNEGMAAEEAVKERVLAASSVQADVRRLNIYVLDAFCSAGIPAVSLPPGAVGRAEGGVLSHFDTGVFADALATGFVPVSFGDVVLDSIRGFSICSGDEVMHSIVSEMDVERVFFVCDVDGLYDRDPKGDPGAVFHRKISVNEIREMSREESLSEKEGKDVTGAMWGKVKWAVKMAEQGIPVHFVNGTVSGRLCDALNGNNVIQTILED